MLFERNKRLFKNFQGGLGAQSKPPSPPPAVANPRLEGNSHCVRLIFLVKFHALFKNRPTTRMLCNFRRCVSCSRGSPPRVLIARDDLLDSEIVEFLVRFQRVVKYIHKNVVSLIVARFSRRMKPAHNFLIASNCSLHFYL